MEFAKKRTVMHNLKKEDDKQKEWKDKVWKAWQEKGPRTSGLAFDNFMKTVSDRLKTPSTGGCTSECTRRPNLGGSVVETVPSIDGTG